MTTGRVVHQFLLRYTMMYQSARRSVLTSLASHRIMAPCIDVSCLMLNRPRFLAFLVLSAGTFLLAPSPSHPMDFANTSKVRIGALWLLLPTPVGFVETSAAAPDVWQTAQLFSTAEGRVVAHYVLSQELEFYRKEGGRYFLHYLFVRTIRRAESIVTTQAQFDRLKSETITLQSALAKKLEPRLTAELERVSKQLSSKEGRVLSLRIGQFAPVSVNENRPNFLSYTVMGKIESNDRGKTVEKIFMVTNGMCYLTGKIVFLNDYRQFRTPQDLQTSREFVERWANALFSAN